MKISLCMIVKNEEKYIKMCLENAMKLVDEVIIVDTGSEDRTKEIISEFEGNVKVIDYNWEYDFSKARNISLEAASGDWILMLDADEKLLCEPSKVKTMLENSNADGYKIPLYNILDTKVIVYSAVYVKIFRNNKGYRYSGSIHEQLNIPNVQEDKYIVDEKICRIIHYGYLASVIKEKGKNERNLKILRKEQKEKPNDPFVYYNLGVTYHIAGNYKKALEYFFKCNKFAYSKDPTGLTLYEIDMSKRIAECLVKLKKYTECIEMVDNLLSDSSYCGFVDLEYIKGFCYYFQKKYKKAIISYEKCIDMGDTKKFPSILGTGSFKAKYMIARCYECLNDELKAINMFMESVFDSNNFMHEGLDDFRKYLMINNRLEILNELNRLIEK